MTMSDYAVSIPTQHERNWAAVAHLTVFLTLLVAASTAGLGHIVGLLVPLAIYVYFSNRSRYVAYHALQATVFQAVAGILYVIAASLAGAMIAVAWTVSGILAVVLVGIALMPAALALTLAAGVELVGLPALALFYSAYGAYLIYKGQEFDYPVLGRLVARSMGPGGLGRF
jgi:uncharacterized Tic20 family protein